MFEERLLANAEDLLGVRDTLAEMAPATSEAEAIDRVRALEELKAACAAAQAREATAFDRLRRQAEAEAGVPAAERGRGAAAEVALARRESPTRGSRHLGLAKALTGEMPNTLAALTTGALSEEKATILCRETAWLPVEARREVDELMAPRLGKLGLKRLATEARGHAQRLDQAAAVKHLERSATERRVSVRPAPGNMAYLTALVPMPQAVAAYANLHRAADATLGAGDSEKRTHAQIMADALTELLTGQQSAADVPVEVHLVMTDQALLAGDDTPAWIPGHGPLPAETARRLLTETRADVFLRRLYTAPGTGQLVSMDSRRRAFAGLLRRMIILREGTCRTPWCEAPIRHADHAISYNDGGPTTWENASGLCARCNYTKENPGWQHRTTSDRLDVTTPTGHHYHRDTGPLIPGAPPDTAEPPRTADPPGGAALLPSG